MENIFLNNQLDVRNNKASNQISNLENTLADSIDISKEKNNVNAEGSETFMKYIDQLGLENDSNLIVLSSVHHYYYDVDELKNVNTLVNLKQLNHISDIDDFLKSVFHALPQGANFIGCFEESYNPLKFLRNNNTYHSDVQLITESTGNDVVVKNSILNMLYTFIDAKTNISLSRKSISSLMKEHGFKILDFAPINGLTYFHARNEKALLDN